MDERWEADIMEFGAINITGFRIVDSDRRYVKDFLDGWRRLDTLSSLGAGKDTISVWFFCLLVVSSFFSSFFLIKTGTT